MKELIQKLKGVKRETLFRVFTLYYLRFSQVVIVMHLFLHGTTDLQYEIIDGKYGDFAYGVLNFIVNLAPITTGVVQDFIYVVIADWAAPMWVYYVIFAVQTILVIIVLEMLIRALVKLGKQPVDYEYIIKKVYNVGIVLLVLYLVTIGGSIFPYFRSMDVFESLKFTLSSTSAQSLVASLIAFLIASMIKEQKNLRDEVESVI